MIQHSPFSYPLSLALLVLKVVLFAEYSAMRSGVTCVGFDPTDEKLVSGSCDETVCLLQFAWTGMEPSGAWTEHTFKVRDWDRSNRTEHTFTVRDWDMSNLQLYSKNLNDYSKSYTYSAS